MRLASMVGADHLLGARSYFQPSSAKWLVDGTADWFWPIAETIALVKYPNVSVTLSSTPLYSAQTYPWQDMDDSIQRVFDAYGSRRCHWGSDMTNSFDKGSMIRRFNHFTDELRFLSETDKDWIMGRSIPEKLRWA